MQIRPSTRRVLIALDPAAPSSATLDALAGLVGAERPEICGLFIEDVTLLGLSSLSVVREVSLDTGAEDTMDTARLERQMHAQRVRVERMLTGAMSRFSVQPEFKVTRGKVRDELRREAQSADLPSPVSIHTILHLFQSKIPRHLASCRLWKLNQVWIS